MNNLLTLLEELESDKTIPDSDEYLDSNILIVIKIAICAESVLINSDGRCNWEHIHTVNSMGYYVFPVEFDGFGWIIGGICTKKGTITYG